MADPIRVAVGGVEALGAVGQAAQLAAQALHLGDPLLDLAGPALEQLDDVGARRLAPFAQGDDLADLPQRQADRLRGPPTTVVPLLPVDRIRGVTGGSFEQVDAEVCTYQPFFASAQAAEGWLHTNPGGRVFTIAEMFERPWHRYFGDDLRPLVHPTTRPPSRGDPTDG